MGHNQCSECNTEHGLRHWGIGARVALPLGKGAGRLLPCITPTNTPSVPPCIPMHPDGYQGLITNLQYPLPKAKQIIKHIWTYDGHLELTH